MPGKSHPKHPRCPSCGKAMYKALPKSKAPKKTDPWRYCRNKKCDLYLRDQSISDPQPTVMGEKAMAEERKRQGLIAEASGSPDMPPIKVVADPDVPPGTAVVRNEQTGDEVKITNIGDEPPAVAKARQRIREILKKAVPGEFDHNIIGVTLALVTQETGNHAAASVLIDEYDLTEKFGIRKVSTDEEKSQKNLQKG